MRHCFEANEKYFVENVKKQNSKSWPIAHPPACCNKWETPCTERFWELITSLLTIIDIEP
jgi:hypothetical protein